jgi:hypothetical protein
VNQDEIDKIAEEHSGLMRKDDFIKMYKTVVGKQDRNYLVVDYRDTVANRFKERFEKVIPYLKNTENKSKVNKNEAPRNNRTQSSTPTNREESDVEYDEE